MSQDTGVTQFRVSQAGVSWDGLSRDMGVTQWDQGIPSVGALWESFLLGGTEVEWSWRPQSPGVGEPVPVCLQPLGSWLPS